MSPCEFERGIVYLINLGHLDIAITDLGLYNWGEPLLTCMSIKL
ncbi:hypothetical protein IMSAG249_00403 [Lachnospiraceae bacterium]|nr:hypothetical protein IMSAGC009_00316 [Lachnospiraceae bacterium]GFI68586.1 hypothetical protein IMSAG249_00403 [Lachnospiraceae bacterium]